MENKSDNVQTNIFRNYYFLKNYLKFLFRDKTLTSMKYLNGTKLNKAKIYKFGKDLQIWRSGFQIFALNNFEGKELQIWRSDCQIFAVTFSAMSTNLLLGKDEILNGTKLKTESKRKINQNQNQNQTNWKIQKKND